LVSTGIRALLDTVFDLVFAFFEVFESFIFSPLYTQKTSFLALFRRFLMFCTRLLQLVWLEVRAAVDFDLDFHGAPEQRCGQLHHTLSAHAAHHLF
jgi:hypothetical protein